MTHASRRPVARILGHVLLLFMGLTTLAFWLPFGRALVEGSAYEWGLFGLGGAGLTRHFWLPTLGVVVTLGVRWWGNRGGAGGMAVVGFFGLLAVVAIGFAVTRPDAMVVRGDTLGMRLSLRWLGPVVFTAATLAALWWARTRPLSGSAAGWTPRHTVFALAIGGLLAGAIVLLRAGPQHGTSDQFGVRALALAWLLLDGVFAPGRPRDRARVPQPAGGVVTALLALALVPKPGGAVQAEPPAFPEGPFAVVNLLWLEEDSGAVHLAAYLERARPVLEEHGGRLETSLATVRVLAGANPPDRVLVVAWSSGAAFLAFVADPRYRETARWLDAALRERVVFVADRGGG